MPKPCYRLRDDEAGVSEVVGTILILAMTVVLFASIIVWVANIPTPPSSTKLDMDASYVPIFLNGNGADVTMRHKGGEDLFATDVRIYIIVERAGVPTTTILKTKGTYTSGPLSGKPYGLVDGQNSIWNIGERWQWSNYSVLPTDSITAIVVDISRNTILWSAQVLGAPGTHPPIFLDKWADRLWGTPTIDTPYTGTTFRIFARMSDADNDLASVTGTLTIFFGTPDNCKNPQLMYDDGTNGDINAADGVWTLYRTCMDSPSLSWDGSIVLFNASDAKGHYTTSRMTLHVQPNPNGDSGGGTRVSGRPPNLRYNGLQGYNLFNGTEWSAKEFGAAETRTFKANEQVVVVVGSVLLTDTRGQNRFTLNDPFSGIPSDPVVYGATKTVTVVSKPSNTQAFTFYKFVNGWNVFVYRFDLNNPSSSGTNFFTNPAHPPNYFFAQYGLDATIVDSTGAQFLASDSIDITDLNGAKRTFPIISTFWDSAFTAKTTSFKSTDTMYVQVSMFTVDASNAALSFGNIVIRDFLGGIQLFKAPINGHDANSPICPVSGSCSGNIVTIVGSPTYAYRFSINLSRANQDGWVDGVQTYGFTINSVHDADEQYGSLATAITVDAPLYKLDLVIGNVDTVNSAWGTHDFSYVYTAVNGIDRWRKDRLLTGEKTNPAAYTKAVKFLDFDRDADLDVVGSMVNWLGNGNDVVFLFRQDIDGFGNPIFTRFQLGAISSVVCNDIGVGDVTGDLPPGFPEIVCGGSDGKVWYFKNDGAWTRIDVDTTRSSAVNSVDLGDFDGDGANDIAVGRADGKVTWYKNLDGQGLFANIAVTDDRFAETDLTVTGTIVANSYLATYVSDDVRESIREGTANEPVASGATTNAGFNTGTTSWTYVDWEQPASASGNYQSPSGNPGGYVDVDMASVSGERVSGFWAQAFTVTGAGPWTATVNLQYMVLSQGNLMSTVTMYAFVDTTLLNAPVPGQEAWNHAETATTGWITPSPIAAGSKITAPGTYYLKIVARTLNNVGPPSSSTVVGFDNVVLSWSSTAGPVSELKHYWRIQQLPNRPLSTYTLNLEGEQSASTEGDNFAFAYAVGGAVTPPADTMFLTVINITATADTLYSSPLPSTLGGAIVWIRVEDTNRVTGNTVNDTVSVDLMYIRVVTPAGTTGTDIVLPAAVTAIDAGDQQPDGFADIVAGLSNGRIYKLLGSSGGLLVPGAIYYTISDNRSISGVKWMNGTLASAGLEIALSYTTNALVITGTGSSGNAISAELAAGGTVTAFGAGDVDGDGDDDVMLGTSGGGVRYWRNLGGGTSWASIDLESGIGVRVYDLDLGDMSNSVYVGR